MIIPEKEIEKYLGKKLADLEGELSQKTISKLEEFETKSLHGDFSVIDYLFLEHQLNGRGIISLAEETYVDRRTLSRIFDIYHLPKLTRSEAIRENWKDPEFRKRHAEAVREELYERWKDPEFRKRNAEAVRENWKDPKFRKRNAEAVREARLSKIPKIKGYRTDIERNTDTTAEANLVRIVKYCNREELSPEIYILEVPKEFNSMFKSNRVKENLDMLVKDTRGNLVGYKILPRPQKKSYAKAEMLREQYNIRVCIITEERYSRLEKWFKEKINSRDGLVGWETEEDNLQTNPTKYNTQTNT